MLPLAALLLALCACTGAPEPEPPAPVNKPIDAFEAVGEPYTPNDGRREGSLSTDVERLQNARRLYELEQERQANEVQRNQRLCREQPDSRKVRIEDGTGKAVYCEPALDSEPGDIE